MSIEKKRILIRMPNWIGDVAMSTPILTALHRERPDWIVDLVCSSYLCPLLEGDKRISTIYSLNSPINGREYDIGLLLTNSFSSAWHFWRLGIPQRIGFRGNWRRLLLTQGLPFPVERKRQHLVKTYQELLKPILGYAPLYPPSITPSISGMELAKKRFASVGISDKDPIIGISPGAAYGAAKCWIPERFSMLVRRLLEDYPQARIIVFGDLKGKGLVDEICGAPDPRVVPLAGVTTLPELVALIHHCRLMVANDSGPMHLATALNIPVLAIFGSTDDIVSAPYNGGIVVRKKVPCSPCHRRTCPIDHRCMTQISVEEVEQAVHSLFKTQLAP